MKETFEKMDNTISCGLMLGGMKSKEIKESSDKNIIFASLSLCSTGLDLPELNCLVLCTSISSTNTLEQCVGRIQRKFDKKFPPLVIDICDVFSCFTNQAKKRLKFYKKKGYTIVDENYEPIPAEEKKTKKSKIEENECMFD